MLLKVDGRLGTVFTTVNLRMAPISWVVTHTTKLNRLARD
jgi:hypothetical protein